MDDKQKKLLEELFFEERGKKPSLAKLLYSGLLVTEHVFPYPKTDQAEQKAVDDLLNQLRSFCEKEIDADAIDRQVIFQMLLFKG